jgi:hypothetical protein
MDMRNERADEGWVIPESLKQLGVDLEREYGIKPLREGEERPDGYYTPNHYTSHGLRSARNDKPKKVAG